MFNYDDPKRQKSKVEVELQLDDGSTFLGNVFVSQTQRVVDLLNDDRRFLPVETTDGDAIFIAKTAIRRVKPVDQTLKQKQAVPLAIGVR